MQTRNEVDGRLCYLHVGGHDRVVRELLARNANVDTAFQRMNQLHALAAHGFKVLVLLLSAEADAEAQDPLSGETALTAACCSGHINIVRASFREQKLM